MSVTYSSVLSAYVLSTLSRVHLARMFIDNGDKQMKYKQTEHAIERTARFEFARQNESNLKLLRKGNLLILTINKMNYRLIKYGKTILCFRSDGLRIPTSLKGQRLYINNKPVNLNSCELRSAY